MINKRGTVYTFYSFKGGVGRSMALANVAALLAKAGNKVLIIDWDLEAPGLEKYFQNKPSTLSGSRQNTPGIVDLVWDYVNKEKESQTNWRSCLLYAHPFREGKPISILTAGKADEKYVSKLQSINWELLFIEKNFGAYLESIRDQWVEDYDFVLIDSRTGITDIGGICTIHLPDALVMFFTANEQSLNGITEVYDSVFEKFKTLPLDRSSFLAIPVPSRFDNLTEHKLATQWKNIFADRLRNIYKEWLPDKTTPIDILEKLFIPYIPFWSFGEGLPVVSEGTSDPRSLGFAYNLLALLLANKANWDSISNGELNLSNDLAPVRINEIAASAFRSLPDYEKDQVKQIFLRLVNPINNTRQILKEKEVGSHSLYLIDEFIKNGLLYRGRDSLTNETTLEISHDSLILYWEDLQTWLKENKDFLTWRQELSQNVKTWEENYSDKLQLLSGTRLRRARDLLNLRKADFNEREVYFINRSELYEKRKKIIKYIPIGLSVMIALMIVFYQFQANDKQKKAQELLIYQTRQKDSANQMLQMENTKLLFKYQRTLDSLTNFINKNKN